MLQIVRMVAPLVLISCFLVSCRGGSDSSSAADAEAFRIAAEEAVRAALITQADLPAEFVPEPDDSDDPEIELIGDCARYNEYMMADDNWLTDVAEADSGDFEKEDQDGFSSSAAAFEDAGAAEAEIDVMLAFLKECADAFESGLTAAFEEALATQSLNVTDVSVDLGTVDVPEHGDWTYGVKADFRFTVDGLPYLFRGESLYVRVGRMIAILEYSYSGDPDIALRDRVFSLVVERLSVEEAKLAS